MPARRNPWLPPWTRARPDPQPRQRSCPRFRGKAAGITAPPLQQHHASSTSALRPHVTGTSRAGRSTGKPMRTTPPQPSSRPQAATGADGSAENLHASACGTPHQRPYQRPPQRPRRTVLMEPTALAPWRPCLGAALALLMWKPAPALAAGPPGDTGAEFVLYRCGAQGRELRNTPCPAETAASQVLHFDPDDAEAAHQTRERVRQEGLQMERSRREREAQAEQQAPRGVLMNARPPPSAASAAAPAASPSQRTAKSRHGKAPQAAPRHPRQPDKPRRDATPATPGTKDGKR